METQIKNLSRQMNHWLNRAVTLRAITDTCYLLGVSLKSSSKGTPAALLHF